MTLEAQTMPGIGSRGDFATSFSRREFGSNPTSGAIFYRGEGVYFQGVTRAFEGFLNVGTISPFARSKVVAKWAATSRNLCANLAGNQILVDRVVRSVFLVEFICDTSRVQVKGKRI